MKHRNFVFLETIIIPWIWFDFGDFGENYKYEKEKFQIWEHVTFSLIMIDYLISNADDPVIKIISVDLSVRNDLGKTPRFKISRFEISTFDLEIELSEIVRSVRWNDQWTKDRDPEDPFEDLWVIKLLRHQYWTASKGHLRSPRENFKCKNEFSRSREIKRTWLLNDSTVIKNRMENSRKSAFELISFPANIWN